MASNHFNNLHVILSIARKQPTCFKHTITISCDFLKRRLLLLLKRSKPIHEWWLAGWAHGWTQG